MTISIQPVNNKHDLRKMLMLPWVIYKNDPLWVPPLFPTLIRRFMPSMNPVIASGRYIAYTAERKGEVQGTIAVAVDERRNATWKENRAIFGFFECVEDYQVAEKLFDAAIMWANDQSVSSLWGPWYFDYEDSHGFLVSGRDHRPALMCAHNKPYYAEFAERYGFDKARRDSLAFIHEAATQGADVIPDKLSRVAEKVSHHSNVIIRNPDFSRFEAELALVTDVLNKGLAVLQERGFWDVDRMMAHARALRPILDSDLIIIAESGSKPVGWLFGLPDLNEAILKAGGVRYLWQKPCFYLSLTRQPSGASMKSIAVDPEYWGRGIDALMIYHFARQVVAKGYKWLDMSLTGEDNPMTPKLAANLGAREYKRYRIYEIHW